MAAIRSDEWYICQECKAVYSKHMLSKETCPCGSEKVPVKEIGRFTGITHDDKEYVVHIFMSKNENSKVDIITVTDAGKVKVYKNIDLNASFRTNYYPVGGLTPTQRLSTELHTRAVLFVMSKICNDK